MKKPTTACLVMLAVLTAGCSTSTNTKNFSDAVEAGADPSKITQATAAGAPKTASECNLNHTRPLLRQNRRLRNNLQYRKQKLRNCTQ